jgi:hypothetical protein
MAIAGSLIGGIVVVCALKMSGFLDVPIPDSGAHLEPSLPIGTPENLLEKFLRCLKRVSSLYRPDALLFGHDPISNPMREPRYSFVPNAIIIPGAVVEWYTLKKRV